MAHRYRLTYQIEGHPDGITAEEVRKAGLGACDAMLLASIIYPADGSQFVGRDGRTAGDLDDNEWFKVWSLLSKRLAESTTLGDGKRMFCQITFDAMVDVLFGGRQKSDAEKPE